MTMRRRTLTWATGAIIACGHAEPGRPALREGDVATVGPLSVPASLVTEVARTLSVSPHDALEKVIADTLAAQGARATRLDLTDALSWQVTTVLARSVPVRMAFEATSLGPPTNDELGTVTVAHAIVLRSAGVSERRALALAVEIRRAASTARTAAEFEAQARGVAHLGAQVVVEELTGISAGGSGPGGAEYDPTFAAAALALPVKGAISEIVESPFGWHTIYLIERHPPDPALLEGLRSERLPAVVATRVRMRLANLIKSRRQNSSIDVSEAAEAVMARAQVQ